MVHLSTTKVKCIVLGTIQCFLQFHSNHGSCEGDEVWTFLLHISLYIVKNLKTMLDHKNWSIFPNCIQGPNSLLSVTSTLQNAYIQAKLRCIQLTIDTKYQLADIATKTLAQESKIVYMSLSSGLWRVESKWGCTKGVWKYLCSDKISCSLGFWGSQYYLHSKLGVCIKSKVAISCF